MSAVARRRGGVVVVVVVAMQECPSCGWMDGWMEMEMEMVCVCVCEWGVCLGDVFGVEVFVRYRECIGGATTVCDNALMQRYIVV